jgi:hypothetical protein
LLLLLNLQLVLLLKLKLVMVWHHLHLMPGGWSLLLLVLEVMILRPIWKSDGVGSSLGSGRHGWCSRGGVQFASHFATRLLLLLMLLLQLMMLVLVMVVEDVRS